MGQSSSKKQKKPNTTKNNQFSRTDKERKSSKRVNNINNAVTSDDFLKHEISTIQNRFRNKEEVQNKLDNNSKKATINTQDDISNEKNKPNGTSTSTSTITDTTISPVEVVEPRKTIQENNHDVILVEKDETDNYNNNNQAIVPVPVPVPENDVLEPREREESITKIDSVLEPVVIVTNHNTKLVRSASTLDNSEVEYRNAPVRRLSVRESTEFRRKQFYQQILSNQSQFDSDLLLSRHSLDSCTMPSRQKLENAHSFYAYRSKIQKYDSEEYPEELRGYAEKLDKIENDVTVMSNSEINLYFATIKDDLHNNWRKIFTERVADKDRGKKVELITRIKTALDVLNNRFLKRKLLFVKY